MKKIHLAALLIFSVVHLFAQAPTPQTVDTAYNFSFEKIAADGVLPAKWKKFNPAKGYASESTTTEKHSGERSLLIQSTGDEHGDPFGSIVNVIPAKYLGKEIEFKAYLKFQDVKNFAGLMIRVDNAGNQSLDFQSMQSRHIKGTKDWALYRIKASIPPDAQTIYVAAILGGAGKLWVDDAQVLIDGQDISQAKLDPEYNPHPYGANAPASGKLKLKTATLYYEAYGNGQPLLLLHGNSQSIYAFYKQIGALSKKYKVIAVDTRGQGRSSDHSTGPLSYDLFAEDMKQLLDSLHIPKADILGWSDGGNTGLIMAVKYPGYVNKLAVMGANLFPTNEAVPDTVLEQVRERAASLSDRTDTYSKIQLRLANMLLTEPHLTFDDMKKIKSPVLVMAGEHDMILEKHTRAIAAAIPTSKIVIFKGATHYAPVEIPEDFNKTVLDFFDAE